MALQPNGKIVVVEFSTPTERTISQWRGLKGDPGSGPGAGGPGGGGPLTCAGKPATIIGTEVADTLTGTPQKDVIVGLGGKDKIRAEGASDIVCAGAGNDTVPGRGRRISSEVKEGRTLPVPAPTD